MTVVTTGFNATDNSGTLQQSYCDHAEVVLWCTAALAGSRYYKVNTFALGCHLVLFAAVCCENKAISSLSPSRRHGKICNCNSRQIRTPESCRINFFQNFVTVAAVAAIKAHLRSAIAQERSAARHVTTVGDNNAQVQPSILSESTINWVLEVLKRHSRGTGSVAACPQLGKPPHRANPSRMV